MLNNRMLVAGPLYQDAEGEDTWGEPGSSAMTGPLDLPTRFEQFSLLLRK